MSQLIYETISLNRHLCNIIYGYIDLSIDKLIETYKLNEYKEEKANIMVKDVMKSHTIFDLLAMCSKIGYKGFFIEEHEKKYYNEVKDSPLFFDGKLKIRYNGSHTFIYFNSKGRTINLDELITHYYCSSIE